MGASMIEYYTDHSKQSIWVLSEKEGFTNDTYVLTCFSAKEKSGFHIGQQIHCPNLSYCWLPLEGEISPSEILHV